MSVERRAIDDYALAAFICGKLPGKVRQQIIDSLLSDDDARHLLAVVLDALTATKEPDEAMRLVSMNWKPAA